MITPSSAPEGRRCADLLDIDDSSVRAVKAGNTISIQGQNSRPPQSWCRVQEVVLRVEERDNGACFVLLHLFRVPVIVSGCLSWRGCRAYRRGSDGSC